MVENQNNQILNYGVTAAIPNGDTVSGAVDLGGMTLVGLLMPASFTGTAVTFQAAEAAAGTYRTVTDGAGSDYSVTVAASKFVPVDPVKMAGVRFLKIVSGSSEGAARTVTLAARRV